MPRTCTICTHEQRREIDRAVLSGESYRGIARHFAVSEDAIERHKKAHLSAQVVKAAERREERRADSLVDQIEALLSRAKALLDEVFPRRDRTGRRSNPATSPLRFERCGRRCC